MLNKLFGKKDPAESYTSDELVDAGICPNCWGRQEYQDQFREYVVDRNKANNGDVPGKKAFIEQFVQDHITGIKLKGDVLTCPTCKLKY